MNSLREALERCIIECSQLSHLESEFHAAGEPCPVVKRILELLRQEELAELKKTLRIPIRAARAVAKEFNKDQVILLAFSRQDGQTWVTTYGRTLEDCRQAAEGGNRLKRAMGWPEEFCNAKPARDSYCAHCGHSKAHHSKGKCDFHSRFGNGKVAFACLCSEFRSKL